MAKESEQNSDLIGAYVEYCEAQRIKSDAAIDKDIERIEGKIKDKTQKLSPSP